MNLSLTFLATLTVLGTLAPPSYSQVTPDERNTIEVFKGAAPAVVHVKAKRLISTAAAETTAAEGAGSGFLIDSSGHILTNYHVIDNSSEIQLFLAGGRTLKARVVGTAPALDLALLEAAAPAAALSELSPLSLGDSATVEIGQKVLAIGNPLGLQNTLTVGVISGLARDIPGAPVGLGHAFLQTDAAINPGNSGGPLLDSQGRVIGINTVVARDGQNIGFAIPIDLVKQILPDLVRMGHVYQPALGFSAIPITPRMTALFALPVRDGLLVQEVAEGSPAAIAGLQAGRRMVPMGGRVYVLGGDIVIAVNETPLSFLHELTTVIMNSKPGERLRLSILRKGQHQEKVITLPPMHLQ